MTKRKTRFVFIDDAIVDCFRKYFVWKGTATRAEYWWVWLVNWAINVVAGNFIPFANRLWSVIIVIPATMLTIRRMHDIGKSGWTLHLTLFGVILLWLLAYGVVSADAYEGNLMLMIFTILSLPAIFMGIILVLVWMAMPSKYEGNKYRIKAS